MKAAILGGSFSPIHMAHLHLADEVRTVLGYDCIIFVPACIPPHKILYPAVSAEQRLEMTRRAIAHNPFFLVEDYEIARGGVSYTIDTIAYLEQKYKAVLTTPFGLIIGDDLTAEFSLWRNAHELARCVELIVAARIIPSTSDTHSTAHITQNEFNEDLYPHVKLHNAILPISSTNVRFRIEKGYAWHYLLPQPVYEYIISENLYGYRSNN